jgi:cell division protein FtsI/penicillin-binding protein 2
MMLWIQLLLVASISGGTNDIERAANSQANYIAVDVRTRAVIGQHWSDSNGSDATAPIPLGSLVKPFTALAYSGPFPEFVCKGAASRCWLAQGHGRVRFREALAQSCNAYFLNLARGIDPGTLAVVAAKFGIAAPEVDSAEARIGLGDGWRISPLGLAQAYAELASRVGEPRVGEILAGLELAARSGTASAIGRGGLAKTGTARCAENGPGSRTHATDGFTIVLAPADSPRIALLVRVHGVTGAEAAKSAARILREMRAGP